jgi:predicted flap endonuclease-1-like 5' DNA nuclease
MPLAALAPPRIQSIANNSVRGVARTFDTALAMNGLLLLALIVLAIGMVVAYRMGASRASRDKSPVVTQAPPTESEREQSEDQSAASWRARELAEDRHRLFRALADARDDTARYRQLLIDLENNAPPPLLGSPTAPDDLKLIVGIGPVLERMLQQLGISTYRQIARWTERDIDEFNARLPEFPGRIRRDAWVTQARELHHSKYG